MVPPPHSTLAAGWCNCHKAVWRENLKSSPWHLKVLEAIPIESISLRKCILPFDSASSYPVHSKERLACSATLKHYFEISSVKELPLEVTDGLWSTFFPVPKKGTNKMRGCIDLCRLNQHIWYKHFKMEGLRIIQRNDLIMKVDLSGFHMHFLIGQSDGKYRRFMLEGKKY